MITVITRGGCWEQGRRLVCLALVKCLDRNGRALERDSPEVVLDVCARVCVENCRESTSMKGKVGLCSLVKLVIHRVCCSVVMVGYCRRECGRVLIDFDWTAKELLSELYCGRCLLQIVVHGEF